MKIYKIIIIVFPTEQNIMVKHNTKLTINHCQQLAFSHLQANTGIGSVSDMTRQLWIPQVVGKQLDQTWLAANVICYDLPVNS